MEGYIRRPAGALDRAASQEAASATLTLVVGVECPLFGLPLFATFGMLLLFLFVGAFASCGPKYSKNIQMYPIKNHLALFKYPVISARNDCTCDAF